MQHRQVIWQTRNLECNPSDFFEKYRSLPQIDLFTRTFSFNAVLESNCSSPLHISTNEKMLLERKCSADVWMYIQNCRKPSSCFGNDRRTNLGETKRIGEVFLTFDACFVFVDGIWIDNFQTLEEEEEEGNVEENRWERMFTWSGVNATLDAVPLICFRLWTVVVPPKTLFWFCSFFYKRKAKTIELLSKTQDRG